MNVEIYKTLQLDCFFFDFFDGWMTALIASSKTFFKPFPLIAEHSKYLIALISLAFAAPCSYEIGDCPFSRNLSTVSLSSRRSNLVPIKIEGACGQWCDNSGYHLLETFSNDGGEIMLKQTKKTSV